MSDELKQKITNTMLRKDGKLNSAVVRQDWFKSSQLNTDLMQETAWLPIDTTLTERIWCIMHDIQAVPECCICANNASFSLTVGTGYNATCSNPSCKSTASSPKNLNTKLKKYGAYSSPLTIQRMKERAPQLQIKGRETLKKKYGVSNAGKIPGHGDKMKQTLFDRYGVLSSRAIIHVNQQLEDERLTTYSTMCDTVQVNSVVKRTLDARLLYNVDFSCFQCSANHTMFGETFKWRCKNLPTPCDNCSGVNTGSAAQHQITQFIKQCIPDIDVSVNSANILPGKKEIDIVIPSLNLAFEYDGLYWHSAGIDETKENKIRHLWKTEESEKLGYQLIHIWEHEWINKREIVESRIKYLLKNNQVSIYARHCEVREIDSPTARIFFDNNHIQGYVNSSVKIGLFHNDILVAAMTFGTPRYSGEVEWELLRFATLLNHSIVGGASKIFKYFTITHKPISVLSYADRRWSQGGLYNTLGFEFSNNSAPGYYYFKTQVGMRLLNRVHFQKHKLAEKLEKFNPADTEAVNMFNNGYRRIWDCGNTVWIWKQ